MLLPQRSSGNVQQQHNTGRAALRIVQSGHQGGYQETGLYAFLPYARTEPFQTFTSTCVSSGQTVIGYDPRCRTWYNDAVVAGNPDEVIFTAPYSDATSGDTIITSAQEVMFNDGGRAGVVGVDVSMQLLDQAIVNTKVLDNGYAYLLDSDNIVVSYPELDRTSPITIADLEFTLQAEKDAFNALLGDLKQESTDEQYASEPVLFAKSGADWYITLETLEVAGYTVVLVVPKADIYKPVEDMKTRLKSIVGGGTAVITVVILVVTLFGYSLNKKVTDALIAPVMELIGFTLKISNSNLEGELDEKHASSSELHTIYGNMSHMILALRFGNQSYYHGDHTRAMNNYHQVENLMRELNNKRGLGVCWNNKGNVYQQMKDQKEAAKHYSLAVDNAKELIAEAETKEAKRKFKIVLANRLMNLGMFKKEQKDIESAGELLDQAMELHKECDNDKGVAQVMGNWAQLLIESKEIEAASTMANEVFDMVKDHKDLATIQIACMNMGIVKEAENKDAEAAQYYRYVLDFSRIIPKHVHSVCVHRMGGIYARQGRTELANNITATLVPPLNVYFVLDVSGSMSGGRIKQCRESIIMIMDTVLRQHCDSMFLLTFSHTNKVVFSLQPLKQNIARMQDDVRNKTRPGGATAFYDALDKTLITIDEDSKHTQGQNWIVALTDGEDNRSQTPVRGLCRRLGSCDVSVILITVGQLSSEADLRSIADAAPKGIMIQAGSGTDEIQAGFRQAGQLLTAQLNVEAM